MALMHTPEVIKNWQAVDFKLKATDGNFYSLQDVKGENGLVVMFICNHCPYVKAIIDKIVRDMAELKKNGIGAIAIMPNDVENYPEDSFKNMKKLSKEKNFSFPYVIDETQEIAKKYDAVCTPDFFGFDKNLQLVYRGRLDDAGRDSKQNSKRDLFEAMLSVAKTGKAPEKQFSSMGCSIKWK